MSDVNVMIRSFEKKDRAKVRWICCETGFLGKPIDPVFEDREIFADYLTSYYTDWEPESSLVMEVRGSISGYILGCCHPQRKAWFELWHNPILFLRGLWRYFFHYNPASRKFVHWILTQGRKETPHTPQNATHFHMNLLPASRNMKHTRAMISAFLQKMHKAGKNRIYGQIVIFNQSRTELLFARYGFEVLDKVEVTKYRGLHPHPVYLFTVFRDLSTNFKNDPLAVHEDPVIA